MSKNQNTQFTIGQFAALHGINKKTLMWYDEIGLFKPAAIKKNGYRYYTYYQSSVLETILMLRELNVSIGEIREFMELRSPSRLKELLEEKIKEVDKTVNHLKQLRKTLTARKEEMSFLLSLDLSDITVVEKEKRYIAVVDTPQGMSFETEIEMVIEEAGKYQLSRLHDAEYGSMISVENLYGGKTDGYSGMFMRIPSPLERKGLRIQPAGRYLTAYYRGNWDGLAGKYKELLAYAEEKGLKLCGYAYETGINELVINSIDEYVTQIEILTGN